MSDVSLFWHTCRKRILELYWVYTKTIGEHIAFTSSVKLHSYQIVRLLAYTLSHAHTHTQYHQGPAMEAKQTHFSLVNMKSWMCHSVLWTIQHRASADVVNITRICLWWCTILREIRDSISIMCHFISALRQSSTISICALWYPLPLHQQANRLGGFQT